MPSARARRCFAPSSFEKRVTGREGLGAYRQAGRFAPSSFEKRVTDRRRKLLHRPQQRFAPSSFEKRVTAEAPGADQRRAAVSPLAVLKSV